MHSSCSRIYEPRCSCIKMGLGIQTKVLDNTTLCSSPQAPSSSQLTCLRMVSVAATLDDEIMCGWVPRALISSTPFEMLEDMMKGLRLREPKIGDDDDDDEEEEEENEERLRLMTKLRMGRGTHSIISS